MKDIKKLPEFFRLFPTNQDIDKELNPSGLIVNKSAKISYEGVIELNMSGLGQQKIAIAYSCDARRICHSFQYLKSIGLYEYQEEVRDVVQSEMFIQARTEIVDNYINNCPLTMATGSWL